jgi:signal transduction histidine kinase
LREISTTREFPAVAASPEVAAAASSRRARQLLDAAVSRAITALAHDHRNALGVVSMQVEAIAARAAGASPDLSRIQSHASVAADHIEKLAEMTNALIAFARGRASSDVRLIVVEAAALVPLRSITVHGASDAQVDLDAALVRAVVLESLVLALGTEAAPMLHVEASEAGSAVLVRCGAPLMVDPQLEWVVQFASAGGAIASTEDGLRLQFPPIA